MPSNILNNNLVKLNEVESVLDYNDSEIGIWIWNQLNDIHFFDYNLENEKGMSILKVLLIKYISSEFYLILKDQDNKLVNFPAFIKSIYNNKFTLFSFAKALNSKKLSIKEFPDEIALVKSLSKIFIDSAKEFVHKYLLEQFGSGKKIYEKFILLHISDADVESYFAEHKEYYNFKNELIPYVEKRLCSCENTFEIEYRTNNAKKYIENGFYL